MTTIKTTVVKSIHIEGKWPYKYEAPNRRVFKQETIERANARKREVYHQKKKLLGLRVYEMDIDICKELNNASAKSSF
jgi:hypothetical protein